MLLLPMREPRSRDRKMLNQSWGPRATCPTIWPGLIFRSSAPTRRPRCRLHSLRGVVARELIVDVDDEQRRIAYAVVGGSAAHHHATMQVSAEGEGRTRFVWITDVVPDALGAQFQTMIDMGTEAMRRTLEGRA